MLATRVAPFCVLTEAMNPQRLMCSMQVASRWYRLPVVLKAMRSTTTVTRIHSDQIQRKTGTFCMGMDGLGHGSL